MQELELLTPFSREFRDPKMEQQYRDAARPEVVQQLRTSLLVAATIFILLIALDFRLLGLSQNFYLLVGLRLVAVLACLLYLLGLFHNPRLSENFLLLNIVCFILITAVVLVIPLRPATEYIQLTAAVILSFAIYLFFPNRLPWIAILNGYLVLGFMSALILWSNLQSSMIVGAAMVFLFQNAVGMITARRLAALQRQQFALLEAERGTNQLLQLEIESRKHLETKLREQAQKDHLTGLNNRRWFLELAEQELRHSRRRIEPLSLCMVDLDHFKSINDRFGHAIGDKVLVQIAGLCREVLRDSDIIGRFGGEEFVLALPGTDINAAFEVAERLRESIFNFRFSAAPEGLRVTMTAGIAEIDHGIDALDSALQRADKALYTGKESGRNKVVLAPARQKTEQAGFYEI